MAAQTKTDVVVDREWWTDLQRVHVSPCFVAVTAFSFLRSMTFRLNRAAVTGGRVATRRYATAEEETKPGGKRKSA